MKMNFSISLSEIAGEIVLKNAKMQGVSVSKYINDLILSSQNETPRQAILRGLRNIEKTLENLKQKGCNNEIECEIRYIEACLKLISTNLEKI